MAYGCDLMVRLNVTKYSMNAENSQMVNSQNSKNSQMVNSQNSKISQMANRLSAEIKKLEMARGKFVQ